MAPKDFWERISYSSFDESSGGFPAINPFMLRQIMLDATLGDAPAGGISLPVARDMLKVSGDPDQLAQFNDLVATIQNVASSEGNDDIKRVRKSEAIDGVAGLGNLAQIRQSAAPGNPYDHNPAACWARAKELLGNDRYAGAAGLVGTMAAAQWPGA